MMNEKLLLEKFRKILSMSTRISQGQVAQMLGITASELTSYLLEWNEDIPFVINGGFIEIHYPEPFVDDPEAKFQEWEEKNVKTVIMQSPTKTTFLDKQKFPEPYRRSDDDAKENDEDDLAPGQIIESEYVEPDGHDDDGWGAEDDEDDLAPGQIIESEYVEPDEDDNEWGAEDDNDEDEGEFAESVYGKSVEEIYVTGGYNSEIGQMANYNEVYDDNGYILQKWVSAAYDFGGISRQKLIKQMKKKALKNFLMDPLDMHYLTLKQITDAIDSLLLARLKYTSGCKSELLLLNEINKKRLYLKKIQSTHSRDTGSNSYFTNYVFNPIKFGAFDDILKDYKNKSKADYFASLIVEKLGHRAKDITKDLDYLQNEIAIHLRDNYPEGWGTK